jgi:hypothetical protein
MNQTGKQATILIITPTTNNIERMKTKIKEVPARSGNVKGLIERLNPILRGWAEYFRISSHSRWSFAMIKDYAWRTVWWRIKAIEGSTRMKTLVGKYIMSDDEDGES